MKQELNNIDKLVKDALERIEVPYNPDDWALMEGALDDMDGVTTNHDVDTVVKDALVGMSVPYDANDWAFMEAALDDLDGTTTSHDIDTLVKGALVGMSLPYDAKDWDLMESALDDLEAQPIDDLVKNTLESIIIPYDASNWAEMESALEQQDVIEHQAVDDLVKNTLDNMSVPYNPNDWTLMESALNLSDDRERQVIYMKILELLVLIVILWTIFNFTNNTTPYSSFEKPIATTETTTNNQKDNNQSNKKVELPTITTDVVPEQYNIHPNTEQNIGTKTTNQQSIESSVSKNQLNSASFNKTGTIKVTSLDKPIASNYVNHKTDDTRSFTKDVTPIDNNVFNKHNKVTEQNINNNQAKVEHNSSPLKEDLIKKNNAIIETIPVLGVDNIIDESTLKLSTTALVGLQCKPFINLIARPTISADFNRFNSQLNEKANTNSSFNLSRGLSLGMSIGKRWSIHTGVLVGQKQYTPKDQFIEILGGNTLTGLMGRAITKVDWRTLEIPLNAQYNLFTTNRFDLYIVGGINGTFVLDAYYERDDVFYNSETENIEHFEINTTDEQGLLKGGDKKSNMALSSQIGLGMTYHFSSNVSLFIQPQYRKGLTTLGTRDDKLNQFSILSGLGFRF